MIEEKLIDLVSKLEELAPHIWQVAVRQVYATAIADAFLAVILTAIVLVWIFRLSPPLVSRLEGDDCFIFPLIVGWGGTALLGFWAVSNTYYTILKLVNPTYYAIEILMKLIPGN